MVWRKEIRASDDWKRLRLALFRSIEQHQLNHDSDSSLVEHLETLLFVGGAKTFTSSDSQIDWT